VHTVLDDAPREWAVAAYGIICNAGIIGRSMLYFPFLSLWERIKVRGCGILGSTLFRNIAGEDRT